MGYLILLGLIAAIWKAPEALQEVRPMLTDWNRLDQRFKYHASLNGLPLDGWKWLKSIALIESDLGRDSRVKNGKVSFDGLSWGLMQLVLSTARDYEPVTVADLNNEEINLRISAKHFSRLYRKFNVLEHAVKAYNQGEGNMAKEIASRKSGNQGGYLEAADYWAKFQNRLKQVEKT